MKLFKKTFLRSTLFRMFESSIFDSLVLFGVFFFFDPQNIKSYFAAIVGSLSFQVLFNFFICRESIPTMRTLLLMGSYVFLLFFFLLLIPVFIPIAPGLIMTIVFFGFFVSLLKRKLVSEWGISKEYLKVSMLDSKPENIALMENFIFVSKDLLLENKEKADAYVVWNTKEFEKELFFIDKPVYKIGQERLTASAFLDQHAVEVKEKDYKKFAGLKILLFTNKEDLIDEFLKTYVNTLIIVTTDFEIVERIESMRDKNKKAFLYKERIFQDLDRNYDFSIVVDAFVINIHNYQFYFQVVSGLLELSDRIFFVLNRESVFIESFVLNSMKEVIFQNTEKNSSNIVLSLRFGEVSQDIFREIKHFSLGDQVLHEAKTWYIKPQSLIELLWKACQSLNKLESKFCILSPRIEKTLSIKPLLGLYKQECSLEFEEEEINFFSAKKEIKQRFNDDFYQVIPSWLDTKDISIRFLSNRINIIDASHIFFD